MNYSEIQNLALSYSDREDDEVTSKIDSFILITESRINRKLKTMDMTVRTRVATSATKEYYALPVDFDGLKDAEFITEDEAGKRKTAQYVSPEQMNNYSSKIAEGNYDYTNMYYTIVANQIQLLPKSDGLLEIVYFQKLKNLTTNTTNWLSESYPDCYLFGIMVEINAFVKDPEATALWDGRFKEALSEIDMNDSSKTVSGTALQTRIG